MSPRRAFLACCSALVLALACAPPTTVPDAGGEPVDGGAALDPDAGVSLFVRVRDEVFEPSCGITGCHGGPDSSLAPGPRLDDTTTVGDLVDVDASETADDAGTPWKLVVVRDPDRSLLYRVLTEDVDGEQPCTDTRPPGDTTQMPQSPSNGCFYRALEAARIDLVREWIASGAEP